MIVQALKCRLVRGRVGWTWVWLASTNTITCKGHLWKALKVPAKVCNRMPLKSICVYMFERFHKWSSLWGHLPHYSWQSLEGMLGCLASWRCIKQKTRWSDILTPVPCLKQERLQLQRARPWVLDRSCNIQPSKLLQPLRVLKKPELLTPQGT